MVMHRDLPRVLGGGIGKYYFSILPMCLQVDEEAIPGGNSGTRECKKKKKKTCSLCYFPLQQLAKYIEVNTE